jgi:hypothetical protein
MKTPLLALAASLAVSFASAQTPIDQGGEKPPNPHAGPVLPAPPPEAGPAPVAPGDPAVQPAGQGVSAGEAAEDEEDRRCRLMGELKLDTPESAEALERCRAREAERAKQRAPRIYSVSDPEAAALNARIDPALRTAVKGAGPNAPRGERFLVYVEGSRAPFGVIPYLGSTDSPPAELQRVEVLGDDVLAATSALGASYYDLRAKHLPLEPLGEAVRPEGEARGRAGLAWEQERDGALPHGLLAALGHQLRVVGHPSEQAMRLSDALIRRKGWTAAEMGQARSFDALRSLTLLTDATPSFLNVGALVNDPKGLGKESYQLAPDARVISK